MKHKVLMILNYFYPDFASTGQLMTELCDELQNDFEITVISAFPSYTGNVPKEYKDKFIVMQKYKNITILSVRVPEVNKTKKISRLKYIFSYFFYSIIAIFKSGKQDLVFSISQPPILGGVLGYIARLNKKAKFIYNIQDFNPEQIEAVSYSKNKFLIELARKIDNITCKKSDTVLVVGRDMQETLVKRFNNKNVPENTVINNWIDEKKVYPLPKNDTRVQEFKEKHGLSDKFVIMYSGNIGLYYDLENIIKVIKDFRDRDDIIFAFIGEGAMKQKLVTYCNENNMYNVKFIPYQNKEEIIYSLNSADIHIITNAKGIKGVSVPSKIYGVMAIGKPIFGVLEKGSEARNIIEDSNSGVCCEPGDYDNMASALEKLIKDVEESNKYNNGRTYLVKNLSKKNSIEKYKKLFYDLITSK